MADLNKDDRPLVSPARYQDDSIITTVSGEIDLHNSSELRTALLALLAKSQPKKLILNLSQVPYMDSSAIAVLVEALQKMRKHGGKVILTDLQSRVKSLLEIARLDALFVVATDEAAALAL